MNFVDRIKPTIGKLKVVTQEEREGLRIGASHMSNAAYIKFGSDGRSDVVLLYCTL